jgi:hypothetical protein
MAFIHTNFLTGNDTTGNGSVSTPYKTVQKGLAVAVSNDFIKVAGGQWVPVTGTFTFTNSSITVNTATSMVGLIAVNDIITFEDGQFGFDKFHIRITAVTTTTLTMATGWAGPTQVSSGVYKIDTFHYTTATNNATLENVNWTAANQPNGRTGITISGGWSSDYTVQNGWTVGRSTNANPAGNRFFSMSASIGIGDWRQNLIFDRFLTVRLNNFLQVSGSGSTCSMKEMGWVGTVSTGPITASGSRIGIYNVDSSTPVTFYVSPQSTAFWITNVNNVNPIVPESSLETNFLLYSNLGGVTTDAFGAVACSISSANSGVQGSSNKVTVHHRTTYGSGIYANYPGASNPVAFSGSPYYFTKIIYYLNRLSYLSLAIGTNTTIQIEDIEFAGPFANSLSSTLFGGSTGQLLIDLSQEGKTIESVNPSYTFTFGSTGSAVSVDLNTVCQTNLSGIQVRDAEGLKTIDGFSTVYFKDPTNGWLRVSRTCALSPTLDENLYAYAWKVVGVNNKLNSPFTITFRLKQDGAGTEWNQIGVQYGPNANQIIKQSVSLTTEFQDYFITIDPASISDWNTFAFPLYCGVSSTMGNVNSTTNPNINCFVESVTIS